MKTKAMTPANEATLGSMFLNRVYMYRNGAVLGKKVESQWVWMSWNECARKVEHIGRGLLALGLEPGTRIGIFSKNRPEWCIADLAILSIGGVSVPVPCTSTSSEAEYILHHSSPRAIFVGSVSELELVMKNKNNLPDLTTVILCDELHDEDLDSSILTWSALEERKRSVHAKTFYERLEKVDQHDPATIIYTSGTLTDPKGVVLTHNNILSNCQACASVFPLTQNDTSLSLLPLSHSFERTGGFFTMLYVGARIAYAENTSNIRDNLQEISPTILLTVPRFLEKICNELHETIFRFPNPIAKLLLKSLHSSAFLRMVADLFFFRKIRKQFGGKIAHIICGGAYLHPRFANFFKAIRLTVLEGYGLTEASPVVSINLPHKNRVGTAGLLLPNLEARISSEGEILLRGPSIMRGYFEDVPGTQKVLDHEGFLHTGDLGNIDSDGFLSITDRKEEIIMTFDGTKVSLHHLEETLKGDPLIESACVIGDGKPFLTALIVPNWTFLIHEARTQGHEIENGPDLARNPQVRKCLEKSIQECNSRHTHSEQIQRFEVLPHRFSIDRGELTLTLKLQRKKISEMYTSTIDRLYAP